MLLDRLSISANLTQCVYIIVIKIFYGFYAHSRIVYSIVGFSNEGRRLPEYSTDNCVQRFETSPSWSCRGDL